MTDTNNEPVVPSEADRIGTIAVAFEAIADNQVSLAGDLKTIKDRTEEDHEQRKQGFHMTVVLTLLSGLVIALLIATIVLLITFHSTNAHTAKTAQQINDCLAPQGQCAQINATRTVGILGESAHRNEVERLETEIQAADAQGNSVASQVFNDRLKGELSILQQYDDAIKKLNDGQLVPLPSDTNSVGG